MTKIQFILLTAFICFFVGMAGELSAQVTVAGSNGADGTYTSLTKTNGAFAAINAKTHTNNIINIEITANVIDETGATQLNAGTWSSLTIYPTISPITISGDIAGPLIGLNGANNVTIDGRLNKTGSTADMTIKNTSASSSAGTSTIELVNDACINTLQYCNILGSSTASTGGIIFFSTSGGGFGNDFNNVNHCTIGNSGNRPLNAICSIGSSYGNDNSGNYLTANSISNVIRTDGPSYGIYLGSGNIGWEITLNSIYETGTLNFSVNSSYYAIYVSYSDGNTINIANNYIGGTSASCGGSTLTKTGSDVTFYGIYMSAGSSSNNINGNTISKISWSNSEASPFYGIFVAAGSMNVGTAGAGNIIGASSGTGSITYTAGTSGGNFYGLHITGSSTVTAISNVIGSVTVANSAASGAGSSNFYGIYYTSTSASSFSNNTMGNASTASSIVVSSNSSGAAQLVYGIYSSGSNSGAGNTFSGNTVANLVNNAGSATSLVDGIYVCSGKNSLTGNTVHDLSIANPSTASDHLLSTGGIVVYVSSYAQTITGNTIYNISRTLSEPTSCVAGIYFSGSGSNSTVSENFIYGISTTTQNVTSSGSVYGIKIDAGITTCANNIINLSANSMSTLYGIYEPGTSGNNSYIYFNTVYFGSESYPHNSYCLYSAGSANTRDFRNNILNNYRSIYSTYKPYCIYYAAIGGTLTTDYNDYDGSIVGYYNGADRITLENLQTAMAYPQTPIGKDANSLKLNPIYVNAGTTTASDYYPRQPLPGITGTGISLDYSGTSRASTPTMGAIEGQVVVTWTGNTGTDWNTTTNWTQNRVPISVQNVTIPNTSNKPHVTAAPSSPASCNNLIIETGAVLTIDAGYALSVWGTLTNNAGSPGLIIESGGSLINSTVAVSATVIRTINKDNNWHLLSCPMSGTMPPICDGNFAPTTGNFNSSTGATYDFFKFDESVASTGNVWVNLKKSDWSVNITDFGDPPSFAAGKGYLVAYSAAFSGSASKSFIGTLATASTDIPVTANTNTYNLIGNPFPASIDWKNSNWTTRPASLNVDGGGYNMWIYNETYQNYGAFNSASSGSSGTNGVTQYIPPAQGFFVQAKSGGGTLTVPANAKIHINQSWLKSNELIENAFKIKVDGSANTFADEILIEFGHPGNNGGAEKWWGLLAEAPSLYTVKNEQNYSISFLTNITDNPAVSLSFKAGADGNYRFTSTFDPLAFGKINLQDLKTGTTHNLKSDPVYSFSALAGDDAARFILHFTENLSVNDKGKESQIKIYSYNKTICILSNTVSSINGDVYIFNLMGQQLLHQRTSEVPITKINLNASAGYYLVKIVTSDQATSSKVFIH